MTISDHPWYKYDIVGTNGSDILKGTKNPDFIYGLAGDDILLGMGGSDYLDGENGNDVLDGGAGDDWLVGGLGNDILVGGAGNDILVGSTLHFEPDRNNQIDVLIGGTGADTFAMVDPNFGGETFYLGEGFAVITDFNRLEGDKIKLSGSATNNDYSFENTVLGTEISLGGDLIAIVANAEIDPTTDVHFVEPIDIMPMPIHY